MICDDCGRSGGVLSLPLRPTRFTFLGAQWERVCSQESIVSMPLSSAIFTLACSIQIAAQRESHPGLANHYLPLPTRIGCMPLGSITLVSRCRLRLRSKTFSQPCAMAQCA